MTYTPEDVRELVKRSRLYRARAAHVGYCDYENTHRCSCGAWKLDDALSKFREAS